MGPEWMKTEYKSEWLLWKKYMEVSIDPIVKKIKEYLKKGLVDWKEEG